MTKPRTRGHQAEAPNTLCRLTARSRFIPLYLLQRPRHWLPYPEQRQWLPYQKAEAPFLLDVIHMRVDHITSLLALVLEDPLRSAAISLICKRYSPKDSSYSWSQWEPHIQLPPPHPRAEATRAQDHIFAMLRATYTPPPEPAATETQALTNLASVAIPVETFILFTAVTLREEEMAVYTHSDLHPISGLLALLPLINVALAAVFALPGLLTGHRVVDPRRPHDPLSRLTFFGESHQPSNRLSPLSISPPRRSKLSPSATKHPCT